MEKNIIIFSKALAIAKTWFLMCKAVKLWCGPEAMEKGRKEATRVE
jgi:hypothetical protein